MTQPRPSELNTDKWIEKATEDELSIKVLLKHRDAPPSPVCFHSQQMAEKYLKALLIFHNQNFSKVHDLKRLATLIEPFVPDLFNLENEFNILNKFYTTTRYPGDFPEGFSWQDAEEAFRAATAIKEFVLERMKIAGASPAGFGLVEIIIAVAIIAVLGGGGLYLRWVKTQKSIQNFIKPCSTEEKGICTKDIVMMCSQDGKEKKGVPSSCTCGGGDSRELFAKGWKICPVESTKDDTPTKFIDNKFDNAIKGFLDRLRREGVTKETMSRFDMADFSHSGLLKVDSQGKVQVYIEYNKVGEGEKQHLEKLGVTVEVFDVMWEGKRLIQGWVPFYELVSIAESPDVFYIKPPGYPINN